MGNATESAGIVAMVASDDDCHAIRNTCGTTFRVKRCKSLADVGACIRERQLWCMAIVALGATVGVAGDALLEAIETAGSDVPLLLIADVGQRYVTQRLIQLLPRFPTAGVALRRTDDLVIMARHLILGRSQDATSAIVVRASPVVEQGHVGIMTAAAVLGSKRTAVSKLAAACGIATRSLEVRLSGSRLGSPKHLLMWMTTLHAAFRVTRLGWPGKQCAIFAGFASERHLSNCVERMVGARLARIRQLGDFADVLDRFVSEVTSARP